MGTGDAELAPPREGTILRTVEDEMKESYINYAMSVIVGRAIPDARDGLKPVHRRILYGMHGLGLSHNKPFKKCARIVGEVLGKYHPHGDTAVYDALARMAQDFSMRYTLVDGQGNFGSVDGDSPAAMRYTEARLSRIAEMMLEDLDKDTVDFIDNFDATLKEPIVLPAQFPNLLVNGTTGIAVGMATNMPPHNLAEVVDAIIMAIDNPDITVEELMNIVKGPDFPTGGIVYGRSGLRAAYMKGRGTIRIRAKTHFEKVRKKDAIIVTEIPYSVNKAQMLENMAELVRSKVLEGISDIRDESDRKGIRIVIELKREAVPDIVLNNLFKHTRMEVSYGIINLTLVDQRPKVLNLKQLIDIFIKHRFEVVTRRVKFELNKAEKRLHIVQGLIVAVENIDKVIETIKSSANAEEAKTGLMQTFNLSEDQAKAVLDMRLQKLTSMEIEGLAQERKELEERIYDFKDILQKDERVYQIIKDEMLEVKQKFGDERRTEISGEEFEDLVDEDLIPDEDVVVTITNRGYIKRIPIDTYRQQHRGGKGLKGMETREEDYVVDLFTCRTHDYIMFFTNLGKAYWLKTYKLPTGTRYSLGKPIVNLLPRLEDKERIEATIPIRSFERGRYLFFATRSGYVKKTELSAFSHPNIRGIRAISLDNGDELINVVLTDGNREIILASKFGNAARFHEEEVRPMGRTARGVIGMRLKYGDRVVSMTVADETQKILTVTENGYGKRTPTQEYRKTHRGSQGVLTCKISPKNGYVVDVIGVRDDDELIVMSRKGMIIRIRASDVSIHGRATMGVRIMRLANGDQVQSIAVIRE